MAKQILFHSIGLVCKPKSLPATELLWEVAHWLQQQHAALKLWIDPTGIASNAKIFDYHQCTLSEMVKCCDLAIVIGGDGSMLGVSRQLAQNAIPIIGINAGTLGFITDIAKDDFPKTLTPILEGQFETSRRLMLEAKIYRDSQLIFTDLALNDVVISRGARTGMVECRVMVDDHFVTQYRADGLIAATPTGSTAYALSVQGPIMYPTLQGLLLLPVAPHALALRPLVLADDSVIMAELLSERPASVSLDMQSGIQLKCHDRIYIQRATHETVLLHPRGWSFFDTLRKKLAWAASA